MFRRALFSLVVIGLALPAPAFAQRDSIVARVRGVAFDSIHNRPLADAFIAVVGGSWSTVADARGRFQLDSVPAGTRTIVVQHPLLDTVGMSGLRTRVRVAANEEIRVATPSFATLWKRLCGERPVSNDSGVVYGTIRDVASNRPISNVLVNVVWLDSLRRRGSVPERDVGAKNAEAFERARRAKKNEPMKPFDALLAQAEDASTKSQYSVVPLRLQDISDSTGAYRVCGVPKRGFNVRVSAMADTTETDSLDVRPELGVFRRDIRIPFSPVARRSVLAGQLTDHSGNPVPYARVTIAGAGESRSDDSGRFVLRDIEPGSRLVEVRFIGMSPTRATVELHPGDSAYITIPLDRVPMLGAMSVKAAGLGRVLAAEFDSRRKVGLGHIVDSTVISRYNTIENVMRDIPGLTVRRKGIDVTAVVPDGRGGFCEPMLYMDGSEANIGHLFDLSTKEAVAIEAYVQPLTVPVTFIAKGIDRKCGAVLVWTKYAFHNR